MTDNPMNEEETKHLPDWPAYTIGPRNSIFVLGVVSIKYTEMESVLCFLFATVFNLESETATMLVSKMGAKASAELVEQKLPDTQWDDEIKDRVSHFVKGFKICNENRNDLMHSNVAWTGNDRTVLFKTSRQGNTHGTTHTLDELRHIADDMNTYCEYGRWLGNAINITLSDPPVFLPSAFPLPDKPPLPSKVNYSSGAF
jgi:hypothetical protein